MAGATVSYTNPVSYLLLCASITALLFTSAGGVDDFIRGYNTGYSGAPVPSANDALRRMAAHASIIVALVVPVTALFSRGVFTRSEHNFAEHLVFNAYVIAQAALVVTVLDVIAGSLLQPDSMAGAATGALIAVIGIGYYAWAARHFFHERGVAGLLRSAAILVLSCAAYALVAGIAAVVMIGVNGAP